MYRSELPRIYELQDLLPTPAPADACLHNLDQTLAGPLAPMALKQFRDIETDLRGLDDAAWSYLKGELKPLLVAKHKDRGWQQLFDKLNQAKGYTYLARMNCTGIRFIPEMEGQRTPDLEAVAHGRKALCEVKTISVSDEEANRLYSGDAGVATDKLPVGFFNKLASMLNQARAQMQAYRAESGTRRIAYIVVNYDNRTHEYADCYKAQIKEFLASNQPPELEVELDIKPAFYWAQS
jgi:hypothetical protein